MRAEIAAHKPPQRAVRRQASARAGWSTSNSRSTRSSSAIRSGCVPRLEMRDRRADREAGLVSGDRAGACDCSPGCWSRSGWSRPARPSRPTALAAAGRAGLRPRATGTQLLAAHEAGAAERSRALWRDVAPSNGGMSMLSEGDRVPDVKLDGIERQADQPRRLPRPEAGPLFLSEGRHVRAARAKRRISPRSPTNSRRPAPGSSACRRTMPGKHAQVHRQI